jgi:hypothetical protein
LGPEQVRDIKFQIASGTSLINVGLYSDNGSGEPLNLISSAQTTYNAGTNTVNLYDPNGGTNAPLYINAGIYWLVLQPVSIGAICQTSTSGTLLAYVESSAGLPNPMSGTPSSSTSLSTVIQLEYCP